MKSLKWMAVLGLAAAGGVALAAGASKADTGLEKMDRNHDRKIARAMFEMMDTHKDDFVTRGELATGHARLMSKTPAR